MNAVTAFQCCARPAKIPGSATSAAAPPPRPLKSATICGIAVIFTEYAPTAPMMRPMTVPMAMSV